jgi:hypothetical protein
LNGVFVRRKLIVLVFGIVMLLSLGRSINASQYNAVSFTFGFVYGSVAYPDEVHPTDTIVCNLTLTAYVDVTIYNFTLTISGLVGGNWQTLHTEQIMSYSLAMGNNISRQIMFNLPQNVSERLNYAFGAATDKGFGNTAFNATFVRATTYDELSIMYDALLINQGKLQADYDHLSTNYTALSGTYNSTIGDYNAIQTSYSSLYSSYESLSANYTALEQSQSFLRDFNTYLETKYDGLMAELGIIRNLMYVFGISTVVLAAVAIYFRKKAPYIVLQKENSPKVDKNNKTATQ